MKIGCSADCISLGSALISKKSFDNANLRKKEGID